MPKRTLILLLILIIFLVSAGIFIYFYQDYADALVDGYKDQITICANITSEEDCYKKYFCEGIYEETCSSCNGVKFKYCQKISDEVLEQIEKQKVLCENTGGRWHNSKLGSSCMCNGDGKIKIFDKTKGCVIKNQQP